MRAILLTRVSDESQKQAMSGQTFRIQTYSEKKQMKVIKEFEFDESAWKKTRIEFAEVIKLLKEQATEEDPIALCCDKIDRLIRNFTSDLSTLEELRATGKIELHFPSDNLIITKHSPASDQFRFAVGVSLAKYYSDCIRDNVKRRFEQKLRDGEWIGKAPIGYMEETDPVSEKVNKVLDPVRAPLIKKTFELYSTGNYSLRQLAKIMRKEGLTSNTPNETPATRTSIEHILKNPFYYGEMRVKGQLYKHNYEPLITKWLFDKCEEVRDSWHKAPFKHGSKPFTFRGLIKCAFCGCSISSDRKKNKYTYLACTGHRGKCGAVRVREEVISEQIQDVLQNFKMPEDTLNEYKEFLRSSNESEYKFHQTIISEARNRVDRIKYRKKEAYNDKLDKRITADEYDNLCKEWDSEMSKAELDIAEHSEAHNEFATALSTLLDIANRANELFKISKPEQKRQLVNFIFSNLKLEGKKLVFNLKMPFDQMALLSKSENWLRGSDSNRQPSR